MTQEPGVHAVHDDCSISICLIVSASVEVTTAAALAFPSLKPQAG